MAEAEGATVPSSAADLGWGVSGLNSLLLRSSAKWVTFGVDLFPDPDSR